MAAQTITPSLISEAQQISALIQKQDSVNPGLQRRISSFWKRSNQSPPEDLNLAAAIFLPLLADPKPAAASHAALILGSLVENGANPHPLAGPLLQRFVPLLEQLPPPPEPTIEQQVDVLETAATPTPKTNKPQGPWRTLFSLTIQLIRFKLAMRKHRRENPPPVQTESEKLIGALGCAAIAFFSASASLRAENPDFHRICRNFADRNDACGWLTQIFDVEDNVPLLVLEPSTGLGLLARLHDTDVNFSLNMLLMHHFPMADGNSKSRLSPSAAAVLDGPNHCSGECVAGNWNLYNWMALDETFQLPSEVKTGLWIWNEGKPGDIPMIEGRRVILLGPASYHRSWQAQRTFAAMKPRLEIEQLLSVAEVREWCQRLRAAQS
jgi:hypothetical protein